MEYVPDYYKKDLLILGVGNPLFGDDGFGPAVAEELERRGRVPSFAAVLDVGTGVREILFDLILSQERPKEVIIIDALDCGRNPGELFKVKVLQVNTMNVRGKPRRQRQPAEGKTSDWKKAIVTLKKGDKIVLT